MDPAACNSAANDTHRPPPTTTAQVERRQQFHGVCAHLLRPGHLYAAFFVWISTVGGRFLAPFLEHEGGPHGATAAESIGLCLALQSVVTTLLSSVGGAFADACERRYPGKGRILVMAAGISVGSLCCLLHALHYVFSWAESLVWHFGLQVVYAAASTLTIPVLDGVTIQFLNEHPDFTKEDYGRERLYGAVGWAVMHLIMAPLLDWQGFGIVYPLVILSTTGTLVTLYLYMQSNVQRQHMLGQQSGINRHHHHALQKRSSDIILADDSIMDDESNNVDKNCNTTDNLNNTTPRLPISTLCRLLVQSSYGVTFLIAFFTLSQGQAVVDSLVFIFFEFLGSSYTTMGLTVQLTVLFEIPIFQIAPRLLERYGSGVLLLTAAASYVIRAVGYSCVPKGHMVYILLLEPLHGITYACSQTAAVDTAARVMPMGYEATGQGLMGLVRGCGSMVGLALGGAAMDHMGPRFMYRASAALCGAGACLFAAAYAYEGPEPMVRKLVPQSDKDVVATKDEERNVGMLEMTETRSDEDTD